MVLVGRKDAIKRLTDITDRINKSYKDDGIRVHVKPMGEREFAISTHGNGLKHSIAVIPSDSEALWYMQGMERVLKDLYKNKVL